jgi:hypothetical protein
VVGMSGREEDIREDNRRWMWWKYSVHMYENGKMRPVETISGMGGWG